MRGLRKSSCRFLFFRTVFFFASHELCLLRPFSIRTALRFAEGSGHDEVACILRVDPSVSTIQESAAAGSVHEVWALMRQVRTKKKG